MKVAELLALALIASAVTAPSDAQQGSPAPAAVPSRDIPRPDQLEPAVSTSPDSVPAATGGAAAPTAPAAAPAASSAPAAAAATQGTAPAATTGAKTGAKPAAGAAKTAEKKGPDRLELDTTDITGNRELPKVLYIVPWKRSDLGDLVGKPVNSLLDEVLQPLDRDVFRRENRYYDGLKSDAAAPKAGAAPGSGSNP